MTRIFVILGSRVWQLNESATRVGPLGPEHEWQCVYSEYRGISSLTELIPYIYRVNLEISLCKEFPRYC